MYKRAKNISIIVVQSHKLLLTIAFAIFECLVSLLLQKHHFVSFQISKCEIVNVVRCDFSFHPYIFIWLRQILYTFSISSQIESEENVSLYHLNNLIKINFFSVHPILHYTLIHFVCTVQYARFGNFHFSVKFRHFLSFSFIRWNTFEVTIVLKKRREICVLFLDFTSMRSNSLRLRNVNCIELSKLDFVHVENRRYVEMYV